MPDAQPKRSLPDRVTTAILEGAAQTFATRGPDASMADVAVAAGVARATVYRYFPNRQELLDELSLRTLRATEERLGAARLDEVPTQEGITRIVRALLDVGDAFVVVARERARSEAFDRVVTLTLEAVLRRGCDNGDIRNDLPVRWLAEAMLGIVMSVFDASPPRGREDTVAAISSLIVDGSGRRGPRLP